MKDKIVKIVVNINFYLMLLTGVAAIVYTVGDFFDLFDNVSWLANRYEEFMLFMIANISVHLISDHYGSIMQIGESCNNIENTLLPNLKDMLKERSDRISENADELNQKMIEYIVHEIQQLRENDEELLHNLIEAMKKIDIVFLEDEIQMTKYLTRQLKKCKRQVLDLTWSHKESLRHSLPQHRQADNEYERCIDEISNKIQYREIFIFNVSSRLKKLKKRLQENAKGYSCAYFEPVNIPLLQFIILDEEEVIFVSSVYPIKCAIKSKEVASVFTAYYTEVWEKATKIKEGEYIHESVAKKLLSEDY